jgi:N-acetylmuramoyl-L-alanine amidase
LIRRTRLAVLTLSLVTLLPAAAPEARAQGSYVLEHEGRSLEVQSVLLRRDEYLPLDPLLAFFRFRSKETGRKSLELSHPEGTIELRAGRGYAVVNGQHVLLSDEVVLKRRRFHVPVDFVTRAVARLLGVEARHDRAARLIRFDRPSEVVTCEAYADRTRVTVQLVAPPEFDEILRDGRRRVLELTNQELPAQVGGCLFDETLADLEVRPTAGRTRITFFVGPRFASLKVYELPESRQLVFDFLNDSTTSELDPTATVLGRARDVFDTVVLDPGHGGADAGATGPGGVREKDLTLSIALATAALLRERAGLDVQLTRDGDADVGLVTRTEIANRLQADLFVSIHANAAIGGPATGAETYFLHLDATDEPSRTLAALENDATGLGRRSGGDGLELLLWDLAQAQYLEESSHLAEAVQRELNALAGTPDRGVKQANFLVLRGATMPAVLVEVGFLSNSEEERRMRTMGFQQATAEALYRAVLAFRDERRARLGR